MVVACTTQPKQYYSFIIFIDAPQGFSPSLNWQLNQPSPVKLAYCIFKKLLASTKKTGFSGKKDWF